MRFVLRDEARQTERRTPVVPRDAKTLLEAGFDLAVERSTKRIFPDAEYADAGCELVNAGHWLTTRDTVLGLKELPDTPENLTTAFIHFAHIFKNQTDWQDEISRFSRGGGMLYDLEYLTLNKRRTAAFGYWAGWMGAALAAWRYRTRELGQTGPETGVSSFENRAEVEEVLVDLAAKSPAKTAIVIGAKGRSGAGATEALKLTGFKVTQWDLEETRNLDHDVLMAHDLLVNCVLMTGPGLQLLTPADIGKSNLRMISDVSCDPFSDYNPLPVYSAPTPWDAPFLDLGNGVELTAIDNLPSLLPREASEDFSAQLLKSLLVYPHGAEWIAAKSVFDAAVQRA